MSILYNARIRPRREIFLKLSKNGSAFLAILTIGKAFSKRA